MTQVDRQFGFGVESTYGVRVVPTRFLEYVSPIGLKLTRERIDSKGVRTGRRTSHRWHAGVQSIGGDVPLELGPQGTGLLFTHMFGAVVTAGVGPFTHTFTPGALNGKSLSVQVNRPDIGDVNRVFDYTGVKVASWKLDAKVGELVMLTPTFYGAHEQTDQALASASYPAGYSPFVFTHGSMQIAAAEYEIDEISITGDNGLKIDRHKISATTPERPKQPLESGTNRRKYAGSFKSDFIDLTAYNRYVNGTEAALVLDLDAGTSAKLIITMNVRFDGETPDIGEDVLELSQPFVCTSATSDAAAITAVLTNDDATP